MLKLLLDTRACLLHTSSLMQESSERLIVMLLACSQHRHRDHLCLCPRSDVCAAQIYCSLAPMMTFVSQSAPELTREAS